MRKITLSDVSVEVFEGSMRLRDKAKINCTLNFVICGDPDIFFRGQVTKNRVATRSTDFITRTIFLAVIKRNGIAQPSRVFHTPTITKTEKSDAELYLMFRERVVRMYNKMMLRDNGYG